MDHRAVPTPDAGHGPEQVARRPAGQRVPGLLPEEQGRVLRLLLRLLPARGVPAVERHLHREGLVGQRRDRAPPPRHDGLPADAAGRHRGRLGVRHLRAGLARGVPEPAPLRPSGRRARHALDPAEAGRHPLRAQRPEPDPGPLPGEGRHARGAPRLRGARRPHRDVRRRDRTHRAGRPAHRRAARRRRRADDPAGEPLRHRRRADAPGHPAHRGRAAGAAEGVRGARQAARGPAPAHAHQLRPGDDAGGRLLQRDRELLRSHRRSGPGRGPQHPARLLPRRLPDGAGRVPRHGPPAPRPVRRGPHPQGDPRRARLPPAVGGRQPAPHLRRVHGQGEPGRVPVGHPQPLGGGARPAGWWSRSSAPRASSTPRSS